MGRKKKEQAPENKALSDAPENKAEVKVKKIIVVKEYAGIEVGTIIPKASERNIKYMTSKGYWEVK